MDRIGRIKAERRISDFKFQIFNLVSLILFILSIHVNFWFGTNEKRMRFKRASGILLHPTSLPGRYGIGDLGPEAHAFVALLAEAGQRWWQILPVGPTGSGNSPYQSYSSHAGNPLLISPERLVEDGWLGTDD